MTLLPQLQLSGLAERTRTVVEKAYRLQHAVAPSARKALQELVRGMNSYYSNCSTALMRRARATRMEGGTCRRRP